MGETDHYFEVPEIRFNQYSNPWTSDQCDDLYDNFEYYLKNKCEAKNIFKRSWNGIRAKAYSLGCFTKYKKFKSVDISELIDFINGGLLGDGSISLLSDLTGYYQHDSVDLQYINYISSNFDVYNIKYRVRELINSGYYPNNLIYKLSTLSYIELHDLRIKWYSSDGIKIIPKDILLTPRCVANWYFSDGHRGYKTSVQIATMGFIKKDIEFLSELLNDTIDINSYVSKENRINLRKDDGKVFLNYIELYKIKCFEHKFYGG